MIVLEGTHVCPISAKHPPHGWQSPLEGTQEGLYRCLGVGYVANAMKGVTMDPRREKGLTDEDRLRIIAYHDLTCSPDCREDFSTYPDPPEDWDP